MNPEVLGFLSHHKICSLTTLLLDGSPHAAVLHYSHTTNPLTIYVGTENTSRKMEALVKNKSGKASLVIGFSDEEWKTLQMDGDVHVISPEEAEKIQAIHYKKHPGAEKFKNNPETIFIKFTPSWWRYSDYTTNPPTFIF